MLGEAHLKRRRSLGAFILTVTLLAGPRLWLPLAECGCSTLSMLGQAHLEMIRRATWSPLGLPMFLLALLAATKLVTAGKMLG